MAEPERTQCKTITYRQQKSNPGKKGRQLPKTRRKQAALSSYLVLHSKPSLAVHSFDPNDSQVPESEAQLVISPTNSASALLLIRKLTSEDFPLLDCLQPFCPFPKRRHLNQQIPDPRATNTEQAQALLFKSVYGRLKPQTGRESSQLRSRCNPQGRRTVHIPCPSGLCFQTLSTYAQSKK